VTKLGQMKMVKLKDKIAGASRSSNDVFSKQGTAMRADLVVLCRMSLVLPILLSGAALADEPTTTHVEVDPIKIDLGSVGKIETMAMNRHGNLLLGVSWSTAKNAEARPAPRPLRPRDRRRRGEDTGPREYAVKVVSPQGEVLSTLPMKDGLVPKMIHACDDGDVYVCGHGQLARLDERGEVQQQVSFGDVLDGQYAGWHASGVTASKDYFFLAFGDGGSLRAIEDVVRFNRDLSSPQRIVERQFGCCAHIDLDVKDDRLLIAENSRHRVNRFSLDGEKLDTWGRRDRISIEGFAACCNPVNFDFGPDDVLYTAESGVGRVKRYTADGKYLGLVGYVDTTKFDRGSFLASQSCYIPIEVGPGAERIYVMDVRAHIIRVLQKR